MVAAPMLYATKLGPVTTGEGSTYVYVGFTSDARLLPPVMAEDDAIGLRRLAMAASREDLRCDPDLADAGRPLGYEPMPRPDDVIAGRAGLALTLSMGKLGLQQPGLLQALAEGSAAFWKRRPWEDWNDGQPLVAEVRGTRTHTYEASIMGRGGETFGISLYEERGTIREIIRLMDEGRPGDASRVNSIAVTFDEEPAYAVQALREAYDLPVVPVPMRIVRGRPAKIEPTDLLVVAVALRAVADLPRHAGAMAAGVEVDGIDVAVRVTAPEPMETPAA